jgi:hypothetical protein
MMMMFVLLVSTKRDRFDIGAVLLSSLLSELQKHPSSKLEIRTFSPTFFPSYDLSKNLFLVS